MAPACIRSLAVLACIVAAAPEATAQSGPQPGGGMAPAPGRPSNAPITWPGGNAKGPPVLKLPAGPVPKRPAEAKLAIPTPRDYASAFTFNPLLLVQQAVPGEVAGSAVKSALSWGKPVAPTAAADVALLLQPDPANARSRHQVACDRAMEKARGEFSSWRRALGAATDAPESIERFPAWMRATPAGAERSAAADAARALDRALGICFATAPPAGFAPALASSIGALAQRDGIRFCTVYRIGPDTVASARHCVEKDNLRLSAGEVRRLQVQLPGVSARPYAVTGYAGVDDRNSRLLSNDWVVLRTEPLPPANAEVPIAPAAALAVGSRLVIGGLMLATERSLDPAQPVFSSTLSCMVVFATEQCLVHTCNTFPGMSGAPVFIQAAAGWQWVALHSRAAGESDLAAACRPPSKLPADSRMNAALSAGVLPK